MHKCSTINIKIWILNRIIVLRGIIAPNSFWYKISDLFISDASGINLYNDFKKKNEDFVSSNMFGEEIYIKEVKTGLVLARVQDVKILASS